jgi:hypothetical protein
VKAARRPDASARVAANDSITRASASLRANISEPERRTCKAAPAAQPSHISRDACASACIAPGGWPVTSTMPKLRIDAPAGVPLRSNTVTRKPRFANA